MPNEKETGKFKDFIQQNAFQMLGLLLVTLNLYLASLLSPIKSDIRVLADRVDGIKIDQIDLIEKGSVSAQINTTKIERLSEDIREIKDTLVRIESRLE